MEASTTMTVAASASTFSLPSDFKMELNPEMSDSDATGYVRMKKILKDQVESRDTDDTGRPIRYQIYNGAGKLEVTSDVAYTFLMDYYKYFPALDDDDEPGADTDFASFLDECHEAIEYYALARCFERLGNIKRAEYYQSDIGGRPIGKFELKASELFYEDENIALANAQLVMEYPG